MLIHSENTRAKVSSANPFCPLNQSVTRVPVALVSCLLESHDDHKLLCTQLRARRQNVPCSQTIGSSAHDLLRQLQCNADSDSTEQTRLQYWTDGNDALPQTTVRNYQTNCPFLMYFVQMSKIVKKNF